MLVCSSELCSPYVFNLEISLSSFLVNDYVHVFIAESTNAADQPVLSETTSVEIEVEVEVEVDTGNDESQVIAPVDHEKERITEKVVVAAENGHVDYGPVENPVDLSQSAAHSASETTTSTLQEDPPKKSFASVVSYCCTFTKFCCG